MSQRFRAQRYKGVSQNKGYPFFRGPIRRIIVWVYIGVPIFGETAIKVMSDGISGRCLKLGSSLHIEC